MGQPHPRRPAADGITARSTLGNLHGPDHRLLAVRKPPAAVSVSASAAVSAVVSALLEVRPLMERIGRRDSNLADQLRRAAASVPLNLHEGAYSQGRNVRARFHNALGSAAEVRACLDVAEALGYVEQVDPVLRDMLDHVVATLHRLVRR